MAPAQKRGYFCKLKLNSRIFLYMKYVSLGSNAFLALPLHEHMGDELEKVNDAEDSGKTRRRSRLDIIAGILHAAVDRTVKTRIMYGANVNFVQFNEYVDLLLEARLIATTSCGRKTFYRTTEKGRLLLRRFNETEEIIMASNGKEGGRPSIVKRAPMVYLVKK